MRAGQDTQSSIGRVSVIEVEPDGQHLLEKFNGRLNVRNPLLRAPRAETGHRGAGAMRSD
jgi:hypothetical protein